MSTLRDALFLALAFWASVSVFQQPASAEPRSTSLDEDTIRKTAQTFVAAFDAADAKAVAAHFLPEGEFIDEDGNLYRGSQTIEEAFAAYFSEKRRVRLKIDVEAVRLVGSDLAVEEGTSTIVPTGNEPITQSRYPHLKGVLVRHAQFHNGHETLRLENLPEIYKQGQQKVLTFPMVSGGQMPGASASGSFSVARSCNRARWRRLRTVPMGRPRISAMSS